MKIFAFIFLLLIVSGCAQVEDTPVAPVNPLCPTTTAEIAECSATIPPGASPVTVTGTAQFYKRTTTLYAAEYILGAPIPSALPIKFAEVRVLNSAGTIVQCGTTNSAGALKAIDGSSALLIPNTAGTYSVEVLSRANHAMDVSAVPSKPAFQLYASVKKDNCSNALHSVGASISSNGTTATAATLTAYARESESASAIQGGAFNIFNNLVSTYEYLAANTGTVNISCLSPKLQVFWQAGFNPGQYIYPDGNFADSDSVPNISFYLRGYDELYINGGRLGNVTTADTDHFDDAVIIHEISHRIEDVCGKMDSPGGTHMGLFRIDPRLAWSEGWGNYMGAHITRNKLSAINPDPALAASLGGPGWVYYLDTFGYRDGANTTAGELIRLDLTKAGNNPESFVSGTSTYYFDKVDSAANPGEGHFREVSVARSLFKITNTCATRCTNHSDYYDEVWKGMDKITGMGGAIYPFRSSARFYDRLNAAFSSAMPASIDATLNTDEAQQRSGHANYTISGNLTWPAVGIKLVPSMVACQLEIRPKNEDLTVTNSLSDQRYSSHFYTIDKTTTLNPSGVTTITLTATNVAGSSNVDIDLILYPEGYQFVPDSSGTKNTTSTQFVRFDRSGGLIKSITSLDLLSTSSFLLNVRAFTTGTSVLSTTRYTYTLTTNNSGEYLCPSTTF